MALEHSKKRPSRQRSHDKLAISMPHTTVVKARQQATALGVASLSAYISQVVEKELAERTFDDILDEVFREKPMTGEERVWAEDLLSR